MRWLFLFVLCVNVVYLFWQSSQPEKDLYADVSRLKGVEPIVLLKEVGGVQVAATAVTEDKTPEPEPADSKTSESCFTLGPFKEEQNLQGMKEKIDSFVEEVVVRTREEKDQTVYWVFVQPEKSRKDIIELGKRLRSKKIKDFYVIREGEKNNGISLGHFKDKPRAYGLQSKVKKLGFDVRVEPIYKSYTVFWLDYQLSGDEIPESVIQEYIKSTGEGKLGRLNRDCDS